MSFTHPLAGKKIWVTGGAGYLGSAITQALDEAGAQVLCLDLPGKAAALVEAKQLTRTVPLVADFNEAAALPAVICGIIAAHGLPDGVAHLTFASSAGHALEDLPIEEFRKTLDLALTPTLVLCRLLGEKMKVRGSGSVVLFSSMYAVVAPDPRIYHAPLTTNPIDYGASKAALLQMARYLAVHYGPDGVRFNCVTPGPFPNPVTQQSQPGFITELANKAALRRIGQNSEIVGPTLFLLSDSASYVTGHSLAVDGGWTIW